MLKKKNLNILILLSLIGVFGLGFSTFTIGNYTSQSNLNVTIGTINNKEDVITTDTSKFTNGTEIFNYVNYGDFENGFGFVNNDKLSNAANINVYLTFNLSKYLEMNTDVTQNFNFKFKIDVNSNQNFFNETYVNEITISQHDIPLYYPSISGSIPNITTSNVVDFNLKHFSSEININNIQYTSEKDIDLNFSIQLSIDFNDLISFKNTIDFSTLKFEIGVSSNV